MTRPQPIAAGRNARARESRRVQISPVTHSGVTASPVNSTWAGQYVALLCHASACSARNTSRFGQPFAACQATSGTARIAAIRQPSARYRLRSRPRAPVARKPAASDTSRKAIFHFASLASPAHPPMAIHQRGSRLASSLVTSSSVSAQNTRSGTVVVSSCIAPMYSPQVAAARAASSWPVRPAPSSRLIVAVMTTSAARPSAGTIRSPTRELPVRSAETLAISGVSAG